MPKVKISEYSTVNTDNSDIEGINISEGCAPSGINNAIRELMVHLKEFQTGASGDAFTFAGGVLISGSLNTVTGAIVSSGSNSFSGTQTITGGINSSGSLNTFSGTVVMSGANTISHAAGTVSLPSITVNGDTNTGIFFPAADTIAFAEGGVEAMRIDSSGNVGIGTTAPARKLEISSADTNDGIRLFSSSSGGEGLSIEFQSGFGPNRITADIESDASGGGGNFSIRVADTSAVLQNRLHIDNAGNVGIGTSSPDSYALRVLQVNGSSTSASVKLSNSTSGSTKDDGLDITLSNSDAYLINRENGFMAIYTNGGERARITSGGYFKASNDGDYSPEGSGAGVHQFCQTANSVALSVAARDTTTYTSNVLRLEGYRTTTNATWYFLGCYNRSEPAFRLYIADSGNVTNTNGSYGTISDAKLKQDIVDAGSQWDDIKNLRFRKYRLKSDVEANPDAKPLLGLVAQEAELVSPGLIEEHRDTKQETKTREIEKTREVEVTPVVLDEEGNVVEPAITETETYTETEEYTETVDLGTTTKSIKTSVLYMKAVKALQEAMARIETLEAQNAAFEERLAALEAK